MSSASRAECSPPDIKRFTAAVAAIDQWAKQHAVAIPATTRSALAISFCDAALSAQSDDAAINRVAARVVSKYLDREANVEEPMRSMGAILNAELGKSGLARPVMRRLGQLVISYEVEPDQITIGDERLPPMNSVSILPGPITLAGTKAGKIVCTGAGDCIYRNLWEPDTDT
jgi:hypothetical protein